MPDVTCTIDYDSSASGYSHRTVTLHRARQGVASVMLEATCHTRGPNRVFRLDRIRTLVDSSGVDRDPVAFVASLCGTDIRLTCGPDDAGPQIGPLTGKTFAFTGELSRLSRADVRQIVEARGGRVVGGGVAGLSHLVVGTGDGVSTRKINAARAQGATIIDEDAFLALLPR
ncbi:hypothetical protein OEW28_18755 [Defluviimonas sp. WL0002]|uniref:BRCT domain-containing protein n=1 Tax=Albidovulum marisflavi TaxID=2984159 RepID=A0ABT2ZHP1_9RHOB|nr:hypothetical protein [Defluviimonas sp. WL0002]